MIQLVSLEIGLPRADKTVTTFLAVSERYEINLGKFPYLSLPCRAAPGVSHSCRAAYSRIHNTTSHHPRLAVHTYLSWHHSINVEVWVNFCRCLAQHEGEGVLIRPLKGTLMKPEMSFLLGQPR